MQFSRSKKMPKRKLRTNTLIVACSCAKVQDPLNKFIEDRRSLHWGKTEIISVPGATTILSFLRPEKLHCHFLSLLQHIQDAVERSADHNGNPSIKKLFLFAHPNCRHRRQIMQNHDLAVFCQKTELLEAEKKLRDWSKIRTFRGNGNDLTEYKKWIQNIEIALYYGKQSEKSLTFTKVRIRQDQLAIVC